jgi:hypothetical protein
MLRFRWRIRDARSDRKLIDFADGIRCLHDESAKIENTGVTSCALILSPLMYLLQKSADT